MLSAKTTAKEVLKFFSPNLSGKVALVTGGNSGIGLETCKVLALAGARVIMCSRNVDAGLKAVKEEINAPGLGGYSVEKADVVVKQLDLASFASVKSLADDVLSSEQRIDFLVLNAGIMACPLSYTTDGFESQIGTNHFGHCYLADLLLPKMKSQEFPSRIVVVSSLAHKMGCINTDDLHYKKGRRYNSWTAYGQSKLANILFAKALADRLQETSIKVFSLHPGAIQTNLQRNMWSITKWVANKFMLDKNIPQGAATTIFACIAPVLESHSGAYLSDCAIEAPTKVAQDENKELREKLWSVTFEQINAVLQK